MVKLRPTKPEDLPLLQAMLLEAAYWRPGVPRPAIAEALADSVLARYVDGWGRTGDLGVVAEQNSRPIGAAWSRYFTAESPGYGFVDRTVPELSVAVEAACRGQGVGTALLVELMGRARSQGIGSISLSVERDNPSVALYERLGFRRRGSVGDSLTMVVDPERR